MKLKLKVYFKLIIFILIVTALILPTIILSFNDHTYTVTITDKERVRIKEKEKSKYLIFADSAEENGMVFENTDDILRLKFNSSNFYSKLKVGNTYKIKVVGVRFPLFSWYENIIKIEEVK